MLPILALLATYCAMITYQKHNEQYLDHHKTTQKSMPYTQNQPHNTVIIEITPEEEFRAYMKQGRYEECMSMLQKDLVSNLKYNDFRQLRCLSMIERNPHQAQNAKNCLHFLYHYLIEHQEINLKELIKRGGNKEAEMLAQDLSSIQGLLMQAIEADDVAKIDALIKQGAKLNYQVNDIEPIDLAIARGNIRSLKLLIAHGAVLTQRHYEEALLHQYLLEISQNDSDLMFIQTNLTPAAKAQAVQPTPAQKPTLKISVPRPQPQYPNPSPQQLYQERKFTQAINNASNIADCIREKLSDSDDDEAPLRVKTLSYKKIDQPK